MPKTKTFSPRFVRLAGPSGDYLAMSLAPIDQDGKLRGEPFFVQIAADGSRMVGPDGAVLAAPVPLAILNASISGGVAPIQAEIDALDAIGKFDGYY